MTEKPDIQVRILGCGSSGGVPRLGPNWGACDPNEPRNRRSRCSVLVERRGADGVTSVLVDTSPDMRQQLIDAQVSRLDAVLYTHDHADQAHGIDDLRQICYIMRARVPVYMDAQTGKTLQSRFDYCFEQKEGSGYPAILQAHALPPVGETFVIDGPGGPIPVMSFTVEHGPGMQALGFRFADIAYCPDVSDIPEESAALLQGLDVWVVDALRYEPHPTHFHVARALEWIERLQPARAVLTNMHIPLDYQTLRRDLPANVMPAYDGMILK